MHMPTVLSRFILVIRILIIIKSSQIYLYSAFHNTDCSKAASQYQSKLLYYWKKDIQVW